jgi:hypothetical protein
VERAITELSNLADPDLFEESAAGIGHILESVDELDAAARRLLQTDNPHRPSMCGSFPAEVLGNLAEEEAAKALILLDAVRCPRERQQEMARTLRYFYDHVAKGIYAEACRWRPVEFNEVAQRVEFERVQHYLDGPNGADFIVPNDVVRRRDRLFTWTTSATTARRAVGALASGLALIKSLWCPASRPRSSNWPVLCKGRE